MDPLAVTGTIVAILQLVTTLASYLNDARNATADQKKFAVEASQLYSLLLKLNFIANERTQSDDPWHNQVKLLGPPNGPLVLFKSTLERVVEATDTSTRGKRVRSSFKWKWTKHEVEAALQQMERIKSLVNLALTDDLYTLSQAIRGEVGELAKITQQLQTRVERLQIHTNRQPLERLSQWLEVPDPSTNYNTALEKRHPETGKWLLVSQQFKDWKNTSPNFMWLYGNPGCGKTVLSATALQHVEQNTSDDPETVVCYFYFDFNDYAKQSPKKAIRSLLFDIALQNPHQLEALSQLCQSCREGRRQATDEQIKSQLKAAIAQIPQTFIMLDALDECNEREDLLIFLRDLAESQLPGLHILATSRREKDIEEHLSPAANAIINIQSSIVNEDIRVYVRDRLLSDRKLIKWDQTVRDEITTVLMEKADGMFRWVFCQLESIRRCFKLRALKRALLDLPETLDETYSRILERIECDGQLPDALKLLSWLCFSSRPLTLAEAVEILAIENGGDGAFFPEDRLPDQSDVISICASLISYGSAPGTTTTEASIQVRLAHFSVKEYLLSDRCPYRPDFTADLCHMSISESCLHYLLHLCDNAVPDNTIVAKYPLAKYTAEYWWQHAQKHSGILSYAVLRLGWSFLTKNYVGVLMAIQSVDTELFERSMHTGAKDLERRLYYAVLTQSPELVSIFLESEDVNAVGGDLGTALAAAASVSHELIVQKLLRAGANTEIVAGDYGTALQAAAYMGNTRLVRILLDHGADVNRVGAPYGTALQAASHKAHETIVRLLLDRGADINVVGGVFGTALQAASFNPNGYEAIVPMLLDRGADVNIIAGDFATALNATARRRNHTTMQMLLEHGADVNAVTRSRQTPLSTASAHGFEDMVLTLLEAGAYINDDNLGYSDALESALRGGHTNIARMLLDKGARPKPAETTTQEDCPGNGRI